MHVTQMSGLSGNPLTETIERADRAKAQLNAQEQKAIARAKTDPRYAASLAVKRSTSVPGVNVAAQVYAADQQAGKLAAGAKEAAAQARAAAATGDKQTAGEKTMRAAQLAREALTTATRAEKTRQFVQSTRQVAQLDQSIKKLDAAIASATRMTGGNGADGLKAARAQAVQLRDRLRAHAAVIQKQPDVPPNAPSDAAIASMANTFGVRMNRENGKPTRATLDALSDNPGLLVDNPARLYGTSSLGQALAGLDAGAGVGALGQDFFADFAKSVSDAFATGKQLIDGATKTVEAITKTADAAVKTVTDATKAVTSTAQSIQSTVTGNTASAQNAAKVLSAQGVTTLKSTSPSAPAAAAPVTAAPKATVALTTSAGAKAPIVAAAQSSAGDLVAALKALSNDEITALFYAGEARVAYKGFGPDVLTNSTVAAKLRDELAKRSLRLLTWDPPTLIGALTTSDLSAAVSAARANTGWKGYPATVLAKRKDGLEAELGKRNIATTQPVQAKPTIPGTTTIVAQPAPTSSKGLWIGLGIAAAIGVGIAASRR